MALRFIDGFEYYGNNQLDQKWNSKDLNVNITTAQVRTGSQALLISNNARFLEKVIDSQQTWIFGFAIRIDKVQNSPGLVAKISDGATIQVSLNIYANGQIRVNRGTSNILYTTGNNLIVNNTWHYIEFKVLIDSTVGTVDVSLDGTNVISLTNQNTQASGNATANKLALGLGVISTNAYYDDVYMCDGTGSKNNDFLGVVKVDTLYPDGNGNSSQFVGQDANSVDNYLNMDELLFDSDTTYNESSTVAQRDDYTFDAMNITPVTIFGVASNVFAKKDDAGTRSLDLYTRVAAANYDAVINQALAESYVPYQFIWENNPADSLAWEVADVDAAGFGIEVSA